ncbi:MAG: hypothetical protein L7T84_14925, partial [Akkermansiaceae bacterium]|nr:hypothetical protein [Akkermansiaceae bacterium]
AEWGGGGKVAEAGKREKHRPGGWNRYSGLFGRRSVLPLASILEMSRPLIVSLIKVIGVRWGKLEKSHCPIQVTGKFVWE